MVRYTFILSRKQFETKRWRLKLEILHVIKCALYSGKYGRCRPSCYVYTCTCLLRAQRVGIHMWIGSLCCVHVLDAQLNWRVAHLFSLHHFRILHLVFTLLMHMTVGRHIEKLIGTFRMGMIYVLSGIGGNLVSAVFVPYQAEVSALLACINECLALLVKL